MYAWQCSGNDDVIGGGDAADVTSVGCRVRLQMIFQVTFLAKSFGAQRAREWPLSSVGASVAFQLSLGRKCFPAVFALENAGMYAQVQREIPSRDETLVAFVARMRPFGAVAGDVRVQPVAASKCATANAAAEVPRRRRFSVARESKINS